MQMNQYSVNVINENLIRLGEYLALAQAALESKKGTDKALSGVCEVLAMAQGLANDALEEYTPFAEYISSIPESTLNITKG